MGKRNKVTTRDIAEELGISQSTVSMVLSGRTGVSFTPETIKRVKEAAEAMGGHISRVYMPEERYRQHYDALYKEYKTLYQYFGRENQIMKRLKRQAERGDGD